MATLSTLPAAVKLIIGIAVAGLLFMVGEWELGRIIRKQMATTAKRDSLTANVKKTDSVFVVDTMKLQSVRTRYVASRDTLTFRITDTVRVREVLNLADSTVRACTDAVSSCAATIKARDSLIAELRKPLPVRRLTFPGEILYDPFRAEAAVRASAELRLFWGLSAKAEAEIRQRPTAPFTTGALRVGLRKTF